MLGENEIKGDYACGERIWLDKGRIEARILYHAVKRGIDVAGSLVGLIVLSPFLFIVAVLIKLDDRQGPVFYSQDRVGKDGTTFRMYKFRSMNVNADEQLEELLEYNEIEGAMFKMKDDPRVTKIGKLIRKHSIDELPQLWNVFRGEMSLVGPRPPLPWEIDEYTEYEKQRLYVKPGCTGLWQVTARNDVCFDDMVRLDIAYIQRRSVIYDVQLMLKTVVVLIKPNSAC